MLIWHLMRFLISTVLRFEKEQEKPKPQPPPSCPRWLQLKYVMNLGLVNRNRIVCSLVVRYDDLGFCTDWDARKRTLKPHPMIRSDSNKLSPQISENHQATPYAGYWRLHYRT